MNEFQKIALRDLNNMFMGEFSENYIINGKEMRGIVDSPAMGDYKNDGIFADSKVIFINAQDMAQKPQPNDALIIDGKKYFVKSAESQNGLLQLSLTNFRGSAGR